MPHHRQRHPEDAPRASLYDEVTQRIVAELEQGCFPWVQPWDSAAAAPSLPRNALTARYYSGVNILILWAAGVAGGYSSQSWLTFRQTQQAGGRVRKGERGTCVVFADRFVPQAELERAARDGEAAKAVPFLKRFTVFNIAQCDGLRPGLANDPAPLPRCGIAPAAEAVIDASCADFVSAERTPSTRRARIMCRYRRTARSATRSTGIAPRSTNSPTGPGTGRASRATFPGR